MLTKEPQTREEALSMRDNMAGARLGKTILMLLGLGAAGRATVGIYGDLSRNIRKKKERDELEKPDFRDVFIPTKIASQAVGAKLNIPRPRWFLPSMIGAAATAPFVGWGVTGAALKAYRKHRTKNDLEEAKKDFEAALLEEQDNSPRVPKFAADLNALAKDWENGDLDADLAKVTPLDKQANSLWDTASGLYITALIASALGGGALGWNMAGRNSPEKLKIRAYREAMRQRQLTRPVSVVAQTKPVPKPLPQVSDVKPKTEEKEEPPNPEEKEAALKSIGKLLPSIAGGAIGAGGALLAGKAYLKNTQSGRNFMLNQLDDLVTPELMSSFYSRMIPKIRYEFMQRHPVLGQLLNPLLR